MESSILRLTGQHLLAHITRRSLGNLRPRRMDTIMRLRLQAVKKEKPTSDVHFLGNQQKVRYGAAEVLNALRAFDIWSNEALTMQVKVNMGDKKTRLQHLRGTLLLPHPHGQEATVLAFAEGPLAEKAKEFGADIVGGSELIPLVKSGELEFDHCVCTLDFLPNLKDLQNILRKKMPNVKRGSATDDLRAPIELFKNGIAYEADREGRVECRVGKLIYPDSNLLANMKAVLNNLDLQKSVKEDFFEEIALKGTNIPTFLLQMDDILGEVYQR